MCSSSSEYFLCQVAGDVSSAGRIIERLIGKMIHSNPSKRTMMHKYLINETETEREKCYFVLVNGVLYF